MEEDLYGHSTRDYVCGNISPGPPKERTQICLTVTGPVREGRRACKGRLVPAAEGRRPAPFPLRLLRLRKDREALRAMSATAQADPSAPGAHAERGLPPVVAAGGAHPAGGDPAPVDARPAELLVRRGVHARSRASREPLRDASLGLPHREQPAAVVPAGMGGRARPRGRRDRAAPALGAGGYRHGAGRLGHRQGAGRPTRGDRLRGAGGGQPAVRVVLAGGARIRAVRPHLGARDALLPARRCASPAQSAWRLFALTAALALLSHYFAVFLLAPMALWLLADRSSRRAALPALAAVGVVGIALLPLISAQGGHGTQWIGRWALSSTAAGDPAVLPDRLHGLAARPRDRAAGGAADPRRSGLGRAARVRSRRDGHERGVEPRFRRGAWIVLSLAGCGVLLPIALAAAGADYLAPRNLVAAMIPVTALIALAATWPRGGTVGLALAATHRPGLSGDHARHRPQPTAAAWQLARCRSLGAGRRQRTGDHHRRAGSSAAGVLHARAAQPQARLDRAPA